MKITVNCPSYKRPKVETLEYLPFCKVWVCETEYDDYIRENRGYEANIIKVSKGIQGNLCRIRNYILDKEFENDTDVVCILDDDMKDMGRFEVIGNFGYNQVKIETHEFMNFLEKYSLLCEEFGFKLWGVNCNSDKLSYRHYSPFSTLGYIGGPFMCHLKNEIRFDENLPLKEDYDISIQHNNIYRGVLRVNKIFYNVKQSKQKGGCSTYRNYDREKEQLELLVNKWGSNIVKYDRTKNSNTKKEQRNFDYNPVIKIPIRGI